MHNKRLERCPQCGRPFSNEFAGRTEIPIEGQMVFKFTRTQNPFSQPNKNTKPGDTHDQKIESETVSPKTTSPTKEELLFIYHTTRIVARKTVLTNFIALNGPRLSAAIKATIATLTFAKYDNAKMARLAMSEAIRAALGRNYGEWKQYLHTLHQELEQHGIRDEISSLVPFKQGWLAVATGIEDESANAISKLIHEPAGQTKDQPDEPAEPTDEELNKI